MHPPVTTTTYCYCEECLKEAKKLLTPEEAYKEHVPWAEWE